MEPESHANSTANNALNNDSSQKHTLENLANQSLILAVLSFALMFLFGVLAGSVLLLFGLEINQLQQPLPLAFTIIISMLGSYWIVIWKSKGYFNKVFIPQLTSSAKWFAISLFAGVSLGFLVNAFTQWFPADAELETTFQSMLNQTFVSTLLVFFIAVFLAPFFEEYLFRGLVFDGFEQKYGFIGAISVSSVVFMSFHLLEYYQYWVAWLAVLVLAIVLGVIRYRSQSMLNPILCHASYNFTILMLAQQ